MLQNETNRIVQSSGFDPFSTTIYRALCLLFLIVFWLATSTDPRARLLGVPVFEVSVSC
jgi:hypothetical protein